MAEEKQANRTGRRLGLAGAVLAGVVGLSGCVTTTPQGLMEFLSPGWDNTSSTAKARMRAEEDQKYGTVTVNTPKGYSVTLRRGNQVSYEGRPYFVWVVIPPHIGLDKREPDDTHFYSLGIKIEDLDMMKR